MRTFDIFMYVSASILIYRFNINNNIKTYQKYIYICNTYIFL